MDGFNDPARRVDPQAILAQTGAALIVTDMNGVVRSLNPAAERLCGENLKPGHSLLACLLVGTGHRQWEFPPHDDFFQGWGELHSMQGAPMPIEFCVSSLSSQSNNEFLFTIWNRSTRANNSRERVRQCDEAEHANRTKDEFLAMLSHELRTPTNVILSWTEILDKEQEDANLLRQGLDAIKRNAEIQSDLINDLLDISRIITGKFEMHPQPTSPGDVTWAAIESLRFSARDKNVRVMIENHLSQERIVCDPSRLQQIIWNLVSNAIKFSPGGDVRVSLNRLPGWIEISVQDTGEGIDPTVLPYVFERFWQGKHERTRRHGGLGLGLAIVRQLVELHGGKVFAHSEGLGHGATFRVLLPASAQLPADPAAPSDSAHQELEPHAKLKGLNILYVDDSPDSRAVATLLLRRHGAEVTTAASAAEALDALTHEDPDLLLSDIGMPEEDGLSLIRKVRSLEPEKQRHIPAAALTAYAREEEYREAIEAGFDAHITKPIDPKILIRTLTELMGR